MKPEYQKMQQRLTELKHSLESARMNNNHDVIYELTKKIDKLSKKLKEIEKAANGFFGIGGNYTKK